MSNKDATLDEKKEAQFTWTVLKLKAAMKGGYYGDVTITFHDGQIKSLHRTDKMRPPS